MNIREAKEEIIRTIKAYTAVDEDDQPVIPISAQRPHQTEAAAGYTGELLLSPDPEPPLSFLAGMFCPAPRHRSSGETTPGSGHPYW